MVLYRQYFYAVLQYPELPLTFSMHYFFFTSKSFKESDSELRYTISHV